MDETREQLRSIGGDDFAELDSDEQHERIRSELNTEEYTPDTQAPLSTDPDKYNPAVEGYCERLEWTEEGWTPITETEVFQHYPEYVPSDEAIDTLAAVPQLLEVGAGNGYWAHVINENGGKCLPTDIHPEPIDASDYPHTEVYFTDEGKSHETTVWMDVRESDHTVVEEYPGHDALLCHPPAFPWTEELLSLMNPEQRLVLVAQWYPGPDATPKFFERLNTEWSLINEFPVYNWKSAAAHGYVFEQS